MATKRWWPNPHEKSLIEAIMPTITTGPQHWTLEQYDAALAHLEARAQAAERAGLRCAARSRRGLGRRTAQRRPASSVHDL
jgi:hypothetical protein